MLCWTRYKTSKAEEAPWKGEEGEKAQREKEARTGDATWFGEVESGLGS